MRREADVSRDQSASPETYSLTDLYNRYFKVVPANTPARLEAAYRLRYQVYCVENPFENPAEHPEELESDAYDDHSVHSLLIHRPSGAVAGTVRLVLPRYDKALPITHVCDHPMLSDRSAIPAASTAEISRFAISKEFRRRATDRLGADYALVERPAALDGMDRRVIPHITLGLMKAIVKMSWKHEITHWTAVMEPALLRLISRLGIEFSPLGPMVQYHGLRQPCYGEANVVLAGLRLHRPEAWALITEGGAHFPGAAIEAASETANS
jgi:N-acyl amino acid synthase of PEP-CTERM/exosortase system